MRSTNSFACSASMDAVHEHGGAFLADVAHVTDVHAVHAEFEHEIFAAAAALLAVMICAPCEDMDAADVVSARAAQDLGGTAHARDLVVVAVGVAHRHDIRRDLGHLVAYIGVVGVGHDSRPRALHETEGRVPQPCDLHLLLLIMRGRPLSRRRAALSSRRDRADWRPPR